ncbi:MAG: hypothetical protein GY851_04040, partial [bacterium]|nr:hypothetical protein [bacterium]
ATEWPVSSDLVGNDVDEGDFKSALIQWFYSNRRQFGGRVRQNLTIADGSITPNRAICHVDTEGDAAADDLTHIAQTDVNEGHVLIVRQANDARIVTIKHGAGGGGEIILPGNADIILADSFDGVMLQRIGTQWQFVLRLSGLPSSFAHHGVKVITGPGTFRFNHPDGGIYSELFVIG